jgi:ATP adenylyltransferase
MWHVRVHDHTRPKPPSMTTIWSPWRSEYIARTSSEQPSETACFLCDAVASPDKAHYVVAETLHCIVLLNLFPYNAGHMMIAPKEHGLRYEDFSDTLCLDIVQQSKIAMRVLLQTLSPHGFNLGWNLGHAAGAGVPDHAHYHVVPRWNGDANFMTSVSETRVVSNHIEKLWDTVTTKWADR